MKKVVLFDLDNTLYDYDKVHKIALAAVYKTLKSQIKMSKKKFERLYKISKEEIHKELSGTASAHNRILYFQRLIEKTHKTVNPQVTLKLYDSYWNTLIRHMALSKGVLTTLRELKKRNFMIGIVSDMTTQIQLRKIKKLKITNYIDYLVTSEEAGSEKPHAIMFLLALNKFDVKPEEAVMVGDNSINDVEGANSVGLDTILIKQGKLARETKDDYKKPNYTIKKIPELLNILDELNGKGR
jgi:putative hydrolase of the HAD superfamily